MQKLDLLHSGLPDLQFVLMVAALCTADLEQMNAPLSVREMVFNRCWALIDATPPPVTREDRVLNLRNEDNATLEALVHIIQQSFEDQGFSELTWEHPPTEPTRESTPEARPLVERLQQWDPPSDEMNLPPSSEVDPLR